MQSILSFDFNAAAVRVVLLDETPWWIAADIARLLGYRDASNLSRALDADEKATHLVSTPGGDQPHTIISESGLFAAILKSRRPEARRFRRWVTGEVLPALRRHGAYALPAPVAPPAPVLHDSASLGAAVAAVREARRLFGYDAGRAIWVQLGLPAPIAVDPAGEEARLVEAIRRHIAGLDSTTHTEAARALGLDETCAATRLRIGRALRLCGWHPVKARRKGYAQSVYVFRPAVVLASAIEGAAA